jgi:hypothetical protein
VQVAGVAGQGAWLVVVQPQGAFEGGDQALPLGIAGERAGVDQHAPAGDLLAPYPGEQAALDVDAGVDERCRQAP